MHDRRPPDGGLTGHTRGLLDVGVEHDDSTARVVVAGELDAATAPELDATLGALASDDAVRRIVVDLAEVTFIDSKGLQALCRKAKAADTDGFDLAVVGVRDRIRRIFVLTGVDQVVPLVDE